MFTTVELFSINFYLFKRFSYLKKEIIFFFEVYKLRRRFDSVFRPCDVGGFGLTWLIIMYQGNDTMHTQMINFQDCNKCTFVLLEI